MDDPIRSLSTELLLDALLFNVGNLLVTSVGSGQIAKQRLDPSHPAFSLVTEALEASERANAVLRQIGDEWLRRKRANSPDR